MNMKVLKRDNSDKILKHSRRELKSINKSKSLTEIFKEFRMLDKDTKGIINRKAVVKKDKEIVKDEDDNENKSYKSIQSNKSNDKNTNLKNNGIKDIKGIKDTKMIESGVSNPNIKMDVNMSKKTKYEKQISQIDQELMEIEQKRKNKSRIRTNNLGIGNAESSNKKSKPPTVANAISPSKV
eukprot:CAMPEP_0116980286 /NCGR_PEP_ID=MMETSP0467-20121206/58983_1 /TAXON_ID=283647 /ORGANISM="Mesodinium pulex, Strain SPMC105" /LENGTH=181 /DNA_ID=CAMNT_0004674211 /DNA_START=1069 /DNA_END=1610 /DNA_ORIENTATION=-